MKKHDKVKLVTFNGKSHSGKAVDSAENYWKLIGETGIVEQSPQGNSIYADFSKQPRVLVRFEKDIRRFGLIAHNDIENALWILVSDLAVVERG